MADNKNHIFLTETESAAGSFDYRVNASDLLLDLKVLLKEYYIATFTSDGNALLINFNNNGKRGGQLRLQGQRFRFASGLKSAFKGILHCNLHKRRQRAFNQFQQRSKIQA